MWGISSISHLWALVEDIVTSEPGVVDHYSLLHNSRATNCSASGLHESRPSLACMTTNVERALFCLAWRQADGGLLCPCPDV